MIDLVKSWSLQGRRWRVFSWDLKVRGEVPLERKLKGFKKKVCNMVFIEVIFGFLMDLLFSSSLVNLCKGIMKLENSMLAGIS
ncbi:hypothetical protein GIB67_039243 [Kingdonia uniflora]|uniref:Uncharacterized protein n=1 Tax=Kingdonia uniflora TaxID=39325 RepID=A0A7J7MM94_9MAGN|nr:hypothetical protein GIB67_039243 [Kingdonia uniflora]